jgi:PAS domain S-box-containing protein
MPLWPSCENATLINLSKYLIEVLRKDQDFVLFRGQSELDLSRILVLAPAAERPGPENVRQLAHECSLRDELDPAWAARPIGLAQHRDRTVLVLEDPGGTPLDQRLAGPLEFGSALRLAIGLATAIEQLHQRGIIHRDIKPANVLLNSTTGQLWLMGFGIASRLPRERQSAEPPEFIAGTLPYMAPEQTGRMNRSVDSRSDLYSLGVTLYEIFTGTLPFSASDPMGWVHCHIAKQPMPPAERTKDIPGTVSAIVLKLLAKAAEERYQTAAGLEADLRRCLAQWESIKRIDPFTLGAHDASGRLLVPEKLYGRDRESQLLLDCFNQVAATGKPILVLVSGYSGIGKSSVVNELHKAIVVPRGIFISGKFDQYKRDIPYATLAQAFQTLVRQILAKSDAELSHWRETLQEAVGSNGQLIVSLIPEMELIIGKQPPVSEISYMEAERHFHAVFRSFLGVFAREEHPLVLFLDDLQWLDSATLKLLEDFMTQPEVRHLLVIGTFRDNEVGPDHPLVRTLNAIRQTEATVRDVVLPPLSLRDLIELVADTLRCGQGEAEPLAQLVHQKTLGNPFFAIQFLTTLREENLIQFDPHSGVWAWDLMRIRTKGYTDNVADLMAGKLNRLPEKTQEALKQFACLGNEADLATLSLLRREPEESLEASFWEALHAGHVVRQANGYKFLHDRVQEAAYSLIPPADRPSAHLRIGRLLATRTAPEQVEEKIFEIVNQLDLGIELIAEAGEKERVARLNLIAGERAQNSTAYVSALRYFNAGRALLTEDAYQTEFTRTASTDSLRPSSAGHDETSSRTTARDELIFALELHTGQCEYLTGALDTAEERLSLLSVRASNLVDFAAVTAARLELYTTQVRSDRVVEVCLEYLRCVGINWSANPSEEEVREEYDRLWRRLGDRSIESLIDLPAMTEPRWQATMDVLSMLLESALLTGRNLLSLTVARMANLSLEHGNAAASCYGYVWLGMISGAFFDDYRMGYRLGKLGFDLVDQRGPLRLKARVYLCFSYCVLPWVKHLRAGTDLVRRAFDTANETGDVNFAAYSCWNLLVLLFDEGRPLRSVVSEAENALRFVQKAKFDLMIVTISAQLQLVRALMGQTASLGSLSDDQFNEERFEEYLENNPRLAFAACWYWICKLQAKFNTGDYVKALEASQKVKHLSWTQLPFFHLADYHFYGALAIAAHYGVVQDIERTRYDKLLAAHHAQLEIWAQNCPENFANRTFLVSAEIARIEGRELDAERLYEQAIDSAHENGFVQNEGIANELAAAFYAARGFNKIGRSYLRDARHCYLRWGADGKVRQLDELHPDLREESARAPSHSSTTIGAPVEHLDLATVIKASQAISGEIVLQRVIDTLMRTAIEHAGAEQGVLILMRDAEQLIAAEAKSDRDEVAVHIRRSSVSSADLPISLLRYVIRTKESVTLGDASAQNLFSEDEYFRRKSPRSVLCLPLVKQRQLTGILYFENNLAPGVFTPNQLATLELIASQAAISLEQARLYDDLRHANTELQAEVSERKLAEEALEKRSSELRKSEQQLQDIVDNTTAVVFVKDLDLRYLLINREYERRYHLQREQNVGKTDFDFHPHDVAEAIRANDRKVIEGGVPIQFEESVPSDLGEHHYVAVKFPLRDSAGKPYAICGISTDITALKHAKELETKMAREREMFAQQRATQLANANEALREFLDALAAVPELDRFLGQVMAAITGQLGAASSTLRLHHIETNTWELEHIFQNGRVMSPDEAQYPENLRSFNESQIGRYFQEVQVYRMADPQVEFIDAYRRYFLPIGVKTLLVISLVSLDKTIGLLGIRFSEDREFRPEELEIARALATQASLAIELTRLAGAARQSAVLQERNRLAGEIHDSLAQSFTGISMQLGMAREVLLNKEDDGLSYIERANDLARFGLAEARRSTTSLQPMAFQDPGLIDALRMLVERSNIPGRLRCTFRSNHVHDDTLLAAVRQDLLRIAQEAISNAMRHAKATTISVNLRSDPPYLILEVRDNGSGMAGKAQTSDGFGLANMRARVKKLKGSLEIQTARDRGTRIIASVPIN